MAPEFWIGIVGTIVALAYLANGIRLSRGPEGHGANAGRLHIVMAGIFLPVLWGIVLVATA